MPVVQILTYDFICSNCGIKERKYIETAVDFYWDVPEGWEWRYPKESICCPTKKHLYCDVCKLEHDKR